MCVFPLIRLPTIGEIHCAFSDSASITMCFRFGWLPPSQTLTETLWRTPQSWLLLYGPLHQNCVVGCLLHLQALKTPCPAAPPAPGDGQNYNQYFIWDGNNFSNSCPSSNTTYPGHSVRDSSGLQKLAPDLKNLMMWLLFHPGMFPRD